MHAAKDSSLIFLAGSHKGEWYLPTTFLSEQAKWFPEGSLSTVPDIDADPSSFELLQWEVEPGDALAFHMLTLHGSKGTTDTRRAFSVRVMGDDMVHAPRAWRTSPECVGTRAHLACPSIWPSGSLLALRSGSKGSWTSCRRGLSWTTRTSPCFIKGAEI